MASPTVRCGEVRGRVLVGTTEALSYRAAPAALHLDCTIALLRPGLGIICRDWWVGELPESIRDWDWIEATEQEAAWLGVNGIALNPETYLMDPFHERLVAEVRAHGHNVIEVPYDGPSYLGGSMRCSSQPVRRATV